MYNVDKFIEAMEIYQAGLKQEPEEVNIANVILQVTALGEEGGFTYRDVANEVSQEALIYRLETQYNRNVWKAQ
jgi:hypothetical protein